MIGVRFSTSDNFAGLARVLREGLARNAEAAGRVLRSEVIYNISALGPPRSRPGEFPHIDEGRLIESWSVSTAEVSGPSISVDVSSSDPASFFLEVGTERMLPRPILVPTISAAGRELAEALCAPIGRNP